MTTYLKTVRMVIVVCYLFSCAALSAQDWKRQLIFPPDEDYQLSIAAMNLMSNSPAIQWTDQMRERFETISNDRLILWQADRKALNALRGRRDHESEEYKRLADIYTEANEELLKFSGDSLDEYVGILGDQVGLLAAKWNTDKLRSMSDSQKVNSLSPLAIGKLEEWLELSQSQLDAIDELKSKIEEKQAEIKNAIFDELGRVEKEKYELMVSVLEASQREEFEKLVGPPVHWYLQKSNKRIRYAQELVAEKQGTLFKRRGVILVKTDEEKAALAHGNRQKLESLGFKILDDFWYDFVRSSDTHEELDLTESQASTLKKQLSEIYKNSLVTNRFSTERLRNLLDSKLEIPSEVEDIFFENQVEALRQTELQFRLFQFLQSYTLLSPQMSQKLELTKKQVARVKEIKEEYRGEIDAIVTEQRTMAKEVVDEQRTEMISILTDKQIQTIEKLFGISLEK